MNKLLTILITIAVLVFCLGGPFGYVYVWNAVTGLDAPYNFTSFTISLGSVALMLKLCYDKHIN